MKYLAKGALVIGATLPFSLAQAQTVDPLVGPTNASTLQSLNLTHQIVTTPDERYSITRSVSSFALTDLETGALIDTMPGVFPVSGTVPGATLVGGVMANSTLATNDRVVIADWAGNVQIYPISGSGIGNVVLVDQVLSGNPPKDMVLTPDKTKAIVTFHNDSTRIYDLTTDTLLAILPGAGSGYTVASPSTASACVQGVAATNTHAVALGTSQGSTSGQIRVYGLTANSAFEITPSQIPTGQYYDLAITPDGTKAIVSADNGPTAIVELGTQNGQPTATLLETVATNTQADLYSSTPGSLLQVAFLEDMVVTTDDFAIVLGASGNASIQFLDLTSPPPTVPVTFDASDNLHDFAINSEGTRAVVHGESSVYIFDTTTPGSPSQIATLVSPGEGLSSSTFRQFYVENSIEVGNNRAIVAGNPNTLVGNGLVAGQVGIYSLGLDGNAPSQLWQGPLPNSGARVHQVRLGAGKQIAAVTQQLGSSEPMADGIAYFDLDRTAPPFLISGPLSGGLFPAPIANTQTVDSVAFAGTRVATAGNRIVPVGPTFGTREPQFAVQELCQLPYGHRFARPNSSGAAASLSWSGSISIADNNFNVVGTNLPASQPGIAIYSLAPLLCEPIDLSSSNGANGLRYVGSPFVRMLPTSTTPAGTLLLPVDFSQFPIIPNVSVHFQFWYRDLLNPGAFSNLSNVLTACFQP